MDHATTSICRFRLNLYISVRSATYWRFSLSNETEKLFGCEMRGIGTIPDSPSLFPIGFPEDIPDDKPNDTRTDKVKVSPNCGEYELFSGELVTFSFSFLSDRSNSFRSMGRNNRDSIGRKIRLSVVDLIDLSSDSRFIRSYRLTFRAFGFVRKRRVDG